jgi:hypothetical protein
MTPLKDLNLGQDISFLCEQVGVWETFACTCTCACAFVVSVITILRLRMTIPTSHVATHLSLIVSLSLRYMCHSKIGGYEGWLPSCISVV